MKAEFVAMTANLKALMERGISNARTQAEKQKVRDNYYSMIQFYKEQFTKLKAKAGPDVLAYSLHMAIDDDIEKSRAQSPDDWAEVSCRKSCSHCCHAPVQVVESEAELLIAYAGANKIEIDWTLVREQDGFKGSDTEYFLLPKHKNKCVFLSGIGECRVYEHRPASCRKYFVVSPAEQCDARNGDRTVLNITSLDAEGKTSGFMDMDHSKVGLLPTMLLQASRKILKEKGLNA